MQNQHSPASPDGGTQPANQPSTAEHRDASAIPPHLIEVHYKDYPRTIVFSRSHLIDARRYTYYDVGKDPYYNALYDICDAFGHNPMLEKVKVKLRLEASFPGGDTFHTVAAGSWPEILMAAEQIRVVDMWSSKDKPSAAGL